MEALTLPVLAQFLGSLGTGIIFVYLYFTERNQSQKTIKEKDDKLEKVNAEVLSAFQENTRTTQALTDTIRANTEAQKSLTERVTDVLLKGENGNR